MSDRRSRGPWCRPCGRRPNRPPAWRDAPSRSRGIECREIVHACAYLALRPGLLTDAEALDHLCVTVDVLALQVVEQAAALANELEQPAARVMILAVGLEMLGQVVDSFAQNRDLDFR